MPAIMQSYIAHTKTDYQILVTLYILHTTDIIERSFFNMDRVAFQLTRLYTRALAYMCWAFSLPLKKAIVLRVATPMLSDGCCMS